MPETGVIPIVGASGTGKTTCMINLINTYFNDKKCIIAGVNLPEDFPVDMLIHGSDKDDENFMRFAAGELTELEKLVLDPERADAGDKLIVMVDDMQSLPSNVQAWIANKTYMARHHDMLMLLPTHTLRPKGSKDVKEIFDTAERLVFTSHHKNRNLMFQLRRKRSFEIPDSLKHKLSNLQPMSVNGAGTDAYTSSFSKFFIVDVNASVIYDDTLTRID
jgi:hypothetical protein